MALVFFMRMGNMEKKISVLNNNSGSAILSALAAMVIVAIFFTANFNSINQNIKNQQRYRQNLSYDLMKEKARRIGAARPVIYASVMEDGNESLRSCLVDDSAIDHITADDCFEGVYVPINLYDKDMDGTVRLVSGVTGAPATYSLSAVLCELDPDECDPIGFMVTTEFLPHCETGGSCRIASDITFRITITPNPEYNFAPSVFEVTTALYNGTADSWSIVVRPGLAGVPVPHHDPKTSPDPTPGGVKPPMPPPCGRGLISLGGTCRRFPL